MSNVTMQRALARRVEVTFSLWQPHLFTVPHRLQHHLEDLHYSLERFLLQQNGLEYLEQSERNPQLEHAASAAFGKQHVPNSHLMGNEYTMPQHTDTTHRCLSRQHVSEDGDEPAH